MSISSLPIKNSLNTPSIENDNKNEDILLYKDLRIFENIKLTPREIDVLACILFGRSAKIIASYLAISPRTVEGYWNRLLQKLLCNSRQQIISKIEKTRNFEKFQVHYHYLSQRNTFQKNLAILRKYFERLDVTAKLTISSTHHLYPSLQKDLSSLGITTTNEKNPLIKEISITFNIREFKEEGYKKVNIELNSKKFQNNYFLGFISLFENIIPDELLHNLKHELSPTFSSHEKKDEEEKFAIEQHTGSKKDLFLDSVFTKKRTIFFFFSITVIIFSYSIFKHLQGDSYHFSNVEPQLINKKFLLNRHNHLKQIHHVLNTGEFISTVALIGIGGAGKTTLACQYAHSQNFPFIYKINCESRTEVITSFKEMSYALAKSKEDLEELDLIFKILEIEDRRKKIIDFVRKKLRNQKSWILIYDNLDHFININDYLPKDYQLWGKGKIIITSRNANLANTEFIEKSNIIYIKELAFEESLMLLKKIITESKSIDFSKLSSLERLAKKIPPFPLDISIFGNYIKNIPADILSCEILALEENMKKKKEPQEHRKIRYKIIKTSLDQAFSKNKDFQDLLVICSLLNSHSIPFSLLTTIKKENVVNNYILSLKSYSLINYAFNNSRRIEYQISVHLTTQDCFLDYISQDLKIRKNHQIIKYFVEKLSKYILQKINASEYQVVESFVSHLETLSTRSSFLDKEDLQEIRFLLAYTHLFLRNYATGKVILESNTKELENTKKTHTDIYKKNISLLGISYRYTGDIKNSKKYLDQQFAYQPAFVDNFSAKLLLEKARLHRSLGEYDKAKELLEQCLKIFTQQFPEQYVVISSILTNLGTVYRMMGNYAMASKFFQHSSLFIKENLNNKTPTYPWLLAQQGKLQRSLGNYLEAKKILLDSIKIFKKQFAEYKDEIAHTLTELAFIYSKEGEYDKALNTLEESIKVYQKHFARDHARNVWNLAFLGIIKRKQQNFSEAEKLLKKSEELFSTFYSKIHIERGWVLVHLGIIARETGQIEKAFSYFKESDEIFRALLPQKHALISWQLMHIALTFLHKKDYKNALKYGTQSYNQFKEIFGLYNNRTAAAALKLAIIQIECGNNEEAKKLLELSLSIYNTYYKNNNYPELKKVNFLLKKLRNRNVLIKQNQYFLLFN